MEAHRKILAVLAAIWTVLFSRAALAGETITVDAGVTYQTMTGWEATSFAGQDSPSFPLFRDALLDDAADLGINRVRLEIRSGVENPRDTWAEYRAGTIDYPTWRSLRYVARNDDADPRNIDWSGFHFTQLDATVRDVILPLKPRVEARGERLFVNLCYVAFTGQNGAGEPYDHDDPEEYGEFVLATCLHLRDAFGWAPDAWEVILEPDNTAYWRGNTIGRSIAAAARRLLENGLPESFIAPSTTSMANARTYFDGMAAVPGALDHLREISYHRYTGVSDSNLAEIADRARLHGLATAHLEWIGATQEELFKDLTIGMNTAWSQFTIGGPGGSDDGGRYFLVDLADPANPRIQLGSRTRYLRQYFRYIRAGAVRIGAAATGTVLAPVAFRNLTPTGVPRLAVVVKASAAASFTVQGLPPISYGIQYTTSSRTAFDLPDAIAGPEGTVAASIPGAGVITIYARTTLPAFRRGNPNGDGLLDISDPLHTLFHLFAGGPAPCPDAADADDDGYLDLSDVLLELRALFLDGPLPPDPGPASCGPDPSADGLAESCGACEE